MGLNSFAKIFLPKDKVFYGLFEEVAHNVQQMGEKLVGVVHEPDFDTRDSLIRELEDLEHVNDEFTHRIFTELGRNFITPFDREDIHYLATALDDVADNIYSGQKDQFLPGGPYRPGDSKAGRADQSGLYGGSERGPGIAQHAQPPENNRRPCKNQ